MVQVGLGAAAASREQEGVHALVAGDMLVIPNATEDERLRDHPQVVGEPRVVFYAGAVLKTSDGAGLGTLCAIDNEPHGITDDEEVALRTLANCAVTCLEGRLAAKRLSEAQGRLEAARHNRDEFLAMLAHELRAPLAPIHTAVEVLARAEATDTQLAWAQQILRRHVRYMSQIVDDLLSTSLVSRGAVPLSLEPVRLRDLVDRAIELSEAALEKRAHTLTVDVDEALYVDADTTQCPLIIAHLVKNAATYTPRRSYRRKRPGWRDGGRPPGAGQRHWDCRRRPGGNFRAVQTDRALTGAFTRRNGAGADARAQAG